MAVDWRKYPGAPTPEQVRAERIKYKLTMLKVFSYLPQLAEFEPITDTDKAFYQIYWSTHKRAKPSDFYESVEERYHNKTPPRAKDLVKVQGRLGIILWVSREDQEAKVLLFKTDKLPEDDENYSLDLFETARFSGRIRWIIQW